jgi:PAS domain S-box-containing protein
LVALLGVLAMVALLRQLRRVENSEQALRESEERYALAMEGANEGHWDWDIASDRLFLSPKMKAWAGQSSDSVITTRTEWLARTVIHPDDSARVDTALADHFDGRAPRYECEYRTRQPDGQWRWLLSRGRCLRQPSGEPYRFVGSTTDITAEKQAQTDRENLEAQLRQSQKMEAIGTLAGGIAHDFNNILGAILGYGELAHQHSTDGSPLRRYLDNVLHAAGRAKSLVDRILGDPGAARRLAAGGHTPRAQARCRQRRGDQRRHPAAPGGDESVHQRPARDVARRRAGCGARAR